jgi:hypothetical protein
MSDDGGRGDREFDIIALILATALGSIVIGAIGYGVFTSTRVTTAIPTPAMQAPIANQPGPSSQPALPASTTGAR